MHPRALLDRPPATPDSPSAIVTCIHGTWARGARWPAIEAVVRDALGEIDVANLKADDGSLATPRDARGSHDAPALLAHANDPESCIEFHYFDWSGRNSATARERAANALRHQLLDQIARHPLARHILIAHSHGANVALHAISSAPDGASAELDALASAPGSAGGERRDDRQFQRETRTKRPPAPRPRSVLNARDDGDREPRTVDHDHRAMPRVVLDAVNDGGQHAPDLAQALSGVVLLSPPLLDATLVDAPAASANRLLLGAAAIAPLLIFAVRHIAAAAGLSRPAQIAAALALAAVWLAMFRPAAILRRAQALARQLALPRIDVAGLVVHARTDEAVLALSCADAFSRVAREAWRCVNRARAPIADEEERLREARTLRERARAVFDSLMVVISSWSLVSGVQELTTNGHPVVATLLFPFAMIFTITALALVGGSVVLLMLLPPFALLLWPFGVFPTLAAALLDVSVERAPGPAWRIASFDVPFRWGWRHSVYEHPPALECVRQYLRTAPGLAIAGAEHGTGVTQAAAGVHRELTGVHREPPGVHRERSDVHRGQFGVTRMRPGVHRSHLEGSCLSEPPE